MNATAIVSRYLVFQAIAVLAWWFFLLARPDSINLFHPSEWPPESLLAFWLADGAILIVGSLVVAISVSRQTTWASTALWCLAATTWYPTLYCIGVSLITKQGYVASAMMTSMAGMTLSMATIYGLPQQSPATFRVLSLAPQKAFTWTFLQTIVFWGTFLYVLPMGIVEIETAIGIPRFQHPWQQPLSATLFLAASWLGIASGMTMALRGCGTPLPTATAPNLVIRGPYRVIRNPMATAGILQGLAVGWYLGSPMVMIYALCGAVLWHLFVRPSEEADLRARFGSQYESYRRKVGLWIPQLKR